MVYLHPPPLTNDGLVVTLLVSPVNNERSFPAAIPCRDALRTRRDGNGCGRTQLVCNCTEQSTDVIPCALSIKSGSIHRLRIVQLAFDFASCLDIEVEIRKAVHAPAAWQNARVGHLRLADVCAAIAR